MNKIFIGYGLKSEGRNLCVTNILRTLLLEGVNIKLNNYELGGVKVVTEGEHRSDNAVRVLNLLSNKETFNISANCAVTAYMEKKTDDGGVNLEESTIYRTYNIVRDGEILVKSVTISNLNNEIFETLRNANVLFYTNGVKVMENHMFNENMEYVVRFDNLAIVSQSWAQPKNIGLVRLMMEDVDLSEKLSAMRKLIKEYKANMAQDGDKAEYDTHTEEAKETYEVSCVVYDLPKYKAVKVTVDDVRNQYPDIESANKAFKEMSDRQRDIRFVIRCVVMAVENAKSDCGMVWDALAPLPRSKNKMFQTCSFDGQIVRRTEYKKTVER